MESAHQLHIVSLYRAMGAYVEAARANPQAELTELWTQLVLDAHWQEWAAGDFNEARTRKQLSNPVPREDFDELALEVKQLEQQGVEQVVAEAYRAITAQLPAPTPEKAVCIMALPPASRVVLQRMNGVVGSCVGDSILLQIHPRGEDWQRWAAYVLAHEYNHTIAGYIHFYLKGNTSATLLNSILFEGLADSFASALFPGLKPGWIDALSPAEEAEQWRVVQDYLDSTRPEDYTRFIFGQPENGTPPHTGYTLGYRIVQAYLRARPHTSMADLVMLDAPALLAASGYRPGQSQ